MPSLQQTLAQATAHLRAAGLETPRLDAEVLLRHALGLSRTQLIMRYPDPMPTDAAAIYTQLIAARLDGTPVAYLTGEKEFMGRCFRVSPDVLIPRPDTEPLVEWALDWLAHWPDAQIADIGTGSGAIGISIAAAMPPIGEWTVTCADISPAALAVASANADALLAPGAREWVRLVVSDLGSQLTAPVDLLVANLPYLTADQIVQNPVLAAEPVLALNGGEAGLTLIRRLADDLPRLLAPDGACGLEIDPSQADATVGLLRAALPGAAVSVLPDLAGRDRHVIADLSAGMPFQETMVR